MYPPPVAEGGWSEFIKDFGIGSGGALKLGPASQLTRRCSPANLLETIARDGLYDAVLGSAPLLTPNTEIFRQGMKIAVADSP